MFPIACLLMNCHFYRWFIADPLKPRPNRNELVTFLKWLRMRANLDSIFLLARCCVLIPSQKNESKAARPSRNLPCAFVMPVTACQVRPSVSCGVENLPFLCPSHSTTTRMVAGSFRLCHMAVAATTRPGLPLLAL